MKNLDASRDARNPLLLPTGKIDRSAVMKDAWRQYRQMQAYGWDWSRSLRFALARARAMKARATQAAQAAAQPDRPRFTPARPTPEGVALMFEALTGRPAAPDALARAEIRRNREQQSHPLTSPFPTPDAATVREP